MEPLRLQTNTPLSPLAEELTSATASPARGREMRTNLLQKLRPPPLVHAWDFWYEKPPVSNPANGVNHTTSSQHSSTQQNTSSSAAYAPQLVHLHSLANIGDFWSLFNNFDFSVVPPRHTVSLFHAHTKPLWEDPRNARGGAWTFRVPRETAVAFWREVCLLAISEQLQQAVDSDRITFRDDICGVAFSPRYGSVLVTVWNRDAAHEKGVQGMLSTVRAGTESLGLWPGEGRYYYKKHEEHTGFNAGGVGIVGIKKVETGVKGAIGLDSGSETSPAAGEDASASVAKMEEEVAKVRRILDDVKARNENQDWKMAEPQPGDVDKS